MFVLLQRLDEFEPFLENLIRMVRLDDQSHAQSSVVVKHNKEKFQISDRFFLLLGGEKALNGRRHNSGNQMVYLAHSVLEKSDHKGVDRGQLQHGVSVSGNSAELILHSEYQFDQRNAKEVFFRQNLVEPALDEVFQTRHEDVAEILTVILAGVVQNLGLFRRQGQIHAFELVRGDRDEQVAHGGVIEPQLRWDFVQTIKHHVQAVHAFLDVVTAFSAQDEVEQRNQHGH